MPASRVPKESPVATKDRRERTQCQAEKTENVEQVTRWLNRKTWQEGYHPYLEEDHSAQMNNVKAAVAIAWQISPPCQQQMCKSHVQDGSDNMQLTSPPIRYIQEGKTAKVVTVSLSNLRKPGDNGATPALDNTGEGEGHREDQNVCKVDPNRRGLEKRVFWKSGCSSATTLQRGRT